MPDGSQIPLSYRYKVVANSTVNSFKAKELAASDDKHNLRSAMFGALFCGRFTQLPHTNHCGVIWQAQDSKKLACWVLNLVLGFNPTTLSIPTSNAKLPKEWLHEGRRSKSAHPPGRWRLEKESRALWRLWNPSTIFWASSSWIPPLPWSLSESERTARVRVLGSFCWMVATHHTASLFSKWFLSNSNVYDFQWWYQTTTLLVFSDATFNRCRCTHVLIEQFESWLQDQCFRGIPGIWIGGVIQLAMAVKTLKANQIFAHVKLHSLMCQPFHSHQMHMHMSQRYGKVWCSKCLW